MVNGRNTEPLRAPSQHSVSHVSVAIKPLTLAIFLLFVPPAPGFFISVASKGVKAACFDTLFQVLILNMLEGYIILPQELRNCVSKPVARHPLVAYAYSELSALPRDKERSIKSFDACADV